MRLRRRQLVVTLSAWRARLLQLIDGRPGAERVARLLGDRLVRLPARRPADLREHIADLARPIRWPQRSRGSTVLTALPPIDSPAYARLVTTTRRRGEVVLDPVLLRGAGERRAVAVLAAAGAPLVVADGARVAAVDPLLDAMRSARATDTLSRELRSVRLRRAAHDELWASAPDVGVTVLLASRRPHDVVSAVEQIRRQANAEIQIVVGLHGDHFPSDAEARLGPLPDGSAIRRFGAGLPLGAVLDEMVEMADGDLITKWDDDDWYGTQHVADLVRAYRYSGADVVGKAAEFVRLESSDVTIRRFALGAESYSTTLAGGTLLTSPAWLREIGGWTAAPRGVDRAVIDATLRHRGHTYRTHGFQYVLRRRTDGDHTWSASDAGVSIGARVRRPGLDLALADIDGGDPSRPAPSPTR